MDRRRIGSYTAAVIALALLLATVLGQSPLQAQTGRVTVRGRIIERGGGQGIPQAAVSLGDYPRATSGNAGEFEIRGVAPGRYSLIVEAFGYRTLRTTILVLDDVDGTIELDPEPVRLPPIDVRAVTFSLRGRIRERESGMSVPYVTVRIPAFGETSTNDAGGFRFGSLGGGHWIIEVEGFGWLPSRVEIDVRSDTAIDLQLERDPITEQVITEQVEKLSSRIRAVGQSLRVLDRQAIRRSRAATPVDILSGQGGVRVRECPTSHRRACVDGGHSGIYEPFVFIDDRLVQCGLEVLNVYPNAMIDRMEVVGYGSVIRVYTTWFIEAMAAGRVRLQPLTPWTQRFTC